MGGYDVFVGMCPHFKGWIPDWFEGTGVFVHQWTRSKVFHTQQLLQLLRFAARDVSCKKTGVCWKQRIIAKNLTSGLDFFLCRKSWEISFPKDLLSQKMIIPYITPIPRFQKRACFFIPKIFSSWATNEAANFRNPVWYHGATWNPAIFWLFFFVVVFLFFLYGCFIPKMVVSPISHPKKWSFFSRKTNE